MDRKNVLGVIYGKDNIFLSCVEWLDRFIYSPHGKGLDECFKGWANSFREKELPIEEKLRMVRNCAPIIRKVHKESGTIYSFPLAREIVSVVDEGTVGDYNLVNDVLNIVDPNKSLKRYSHEEHSEPHTPGGFSTSGGSVVWEEAEETQERKKWE